MWKPQWLEALIQKKADEAAEIIVQLRMVQFEKEKKELVAQVFELERKLKNREFIDIGIGDPMPVDSKERRLYVGAVAGLHKEILRPKLMQMIAKTREALDEQENTRDHDLLLKGTSYALFEIIRWGDLMASEDQAYNAGQNPSVPEDKEKDK